MEAKTQPLPNTARNYNTTSLCAFLGLRGESPAAVPTDGSCGSAPEGKAGFSSQKRKESSVLVFLLLMIIQLSVGVRPDLCRESGVAYYPRSSPCDEFHDHGFHN